VTAANSSTISSRESLRPSECGSIGDSPGPKDHLYNAGSVGQTGTFRRVYSYREMTRGSAHFPSLA